MSLSHIDPDIFLSGCLILCNMASPSVPFLPQLSFALLPPFSHFLLFITVFVKTWQSSYATLAEYLY